MKSNYLVLMAVTLILCWTGAALSANHYIRAGASGNGSDWENALPELPAKQTRGDIYYIADGEYGLNYLCEGYKHFFSFVAPYMRFMASELRQQKPPANVMMWAKEKDRGFHNLQIGRNDPCPCGSGLKFKKCCGIK